MKELDEFYFACQEPEKSCYLALRDIVLSLDPTIKPEWKFNLPFFYYKGKMFCYLCKDKKTNLLYLAFLKGHLLNHPLLTQGKEKLVKKIFVDPEKDIPIDELQLIGKEALTFY